MLEPAVALLGAPSTWPIDGPPALRREFDHRRFNEGGAGSLPPPPDAAPPGHPAFDARARTRAFHPIPEEWREWTSELGLLTAPIPLALPSLIDEVVSVVDDATPALGASVNALVSIVHVLQAENPECDTSFSEPGMPYSVFLSLPPDVPVQLPRLAESLVHETLHLQLSMIERLEGPLVMRPGRIWSPWKREEREFTGIVHGLYVYVGLRHLWSRLSVRGSEPWSAFGVRRARVIATELREVLAALDETALSPAGKRIVLAARTAAAERARPEEP